MKEQRVVYTPADIQAMLGIRLQTVYGMLQSGEIPSIRIGRNYKISKEKFDEWLMEATERETKERKEKHG